jgi:hypothetical protein
MFNSQVEGEIIEQTCKWDDHTIVIWNYEGAYVMFFPGQEEKKHYVDISQLLKLIVQGHTIDIIC